MLTPKQEAELKDLYQQMSELTQPVCATECRVPFSCCSPEYCELALDWAKEKYGVILETTSHPTLPLMGWDGKQGTGCTVAPHFRPLCTLHTCSINSIGSGKTFQWTAAYFRLRRKIEILESRLAREK